METAPLKSFATSARKELLREVDARLTAVLAPGSSERVEHPSIVKSLEDAIAAAGGGQNGRKHVVDRAAYMWFNRIIALRFMDANGYTGIGVVSPSTDQVGQPEVLALAKRGQIDGEVVRASEAATVLGLLSGSILPSPGGEAQAEAYALLLTSYCRFWNRAMPSMFEREGDFSELLIPGNLLAEGSLIDRARVVLSPEVCEDVEVIGWLYQFYISERKDEVFAGFKKNKKAGADEIPAATQLFTPHWIVRYLAENSIGRLWMLNHPDSTLVERMEYYIEPVDEESDFLRISSPEEITVIDPACGSGHMLTYAFDLLYAIYEEEGYAPSSIPRLILEKNLRGTEIDQRAGALASFALSMKAASKRKRFLRDAIAPRIRVLDPVSFRPDELDFLATDEGDRDTEEVFWNMFEHADTFGSLIQPDPVETTRMALHLESLSDEGDMLYEDTLAKARTVIDQANYLLPGYSVVIANPPYMGSKQMNDLLSRFMKERYSKTKRDLYAAFVIRGLGLKCRRGILSIIVGDTWMSIKSFEPLRKTLLTSHSFESFVHLHDVSNHPNIFGANAAFVVSDTPDRCKRTPFVRLSASGTAPKNSQFQTALEERTRESGFFQASTEELESIPGTPIVYWLSEKMRSAFINSDRLGDIIEVRHGLSTGKNEEVVRLWWEVSNREFGKGCDSVETARSSGYRWFPYNSGGKFRKWYGNYEKVIRYDKHGRNLMASFPGHRHDGRERYFSPSVSWSDISSGEAAFRRYPEGFIYANTGHSAFANTRTLEQIALLMNSTFATQVLRILAPTLHFDIGYVSQVPVADDIEKLPTEQLDSLVTTSKRDWDESETSWDFTSSPLVTFSREVDSLQH